MLLPLAPQKNAALLRGDVRQCLRHLRAVHHFRGVRHQPQADLSNAPTKRKPPGLQVCFATLGHSEDGKIPALCDMLTTIWLKVISSGKASDLRLYRLCVSTATAAFHKHHEDHDATLDALRLPCANDMWAEPLNSSGTSWLRLLIQGTLRLRASLPLSRCSSQTLAAPPAPYV